MKLYLECAADQNEKDSLVIASGNATETLQKAVLAAEILPNLHSAASHKSAIITLVPSLGCASHVIFGAIDGN